MRSARSALALLACGVLVQGCTSLEHMRPGRRAAEAEAEIRALRAELLEARRRATIAEVELDRLRREATVRNEEQPPEPKAAPAAKERGPALAVTPAGEHVAPPQIEEQDLPSDGTEPGAAGALTVDSGEQPAPSESATPRRVSAAGQAAYDRGYTFFHQGRYLDAESAFQQFLAFYGDTDLADNAQFWIGEARFARGDPRGALAAFQETVSRYPGGNKVPDALLKSADCLRDLGDLEGARRAYEEVIREFPSAAASVVAEDRLSELP